MGKRSPILGYNHNVRYRGLVFHVQTEDSGVSTPRLFTHLFHHGVIVSTRRLDYDGGSAEESIKSLMQAQHKAVLRDLRRGAFDDKIDSYLGGTPGLLPRGVEETPERASEAELAPSTGTVEMVAGPPTEQVLPFVLDELSEPILLVERAPAPARATPPPLPARATERHSGPAASAGATGPVAAARGSTGAIERSETRGGGPDGFAGGAGGRAPRGIERSETGGGWPDGFAGGAGARAPRGIDTTIKTAVPVFELSEIDLSPEIEIHLLDDGDEAVTRARRVTRDTETHVPLTDQTRPTLSMEHDDQTRPTLGADALGRVPTISDGAAGAIRPPTSSPAIPPAPDSRRLGDRPSTIHAATLPPARPIPRPASRPAMSPPPVVPRPATSDERHRREAEAGEGYSTAQPSAELPHGERPGQYAQHKKGRIPTDGVKSERERSGGVPVPAGLGRPQRAGSAPAAKTGVGTPVPGVPPAPVPRDPASRGGTHTEPLRGRVPTPPRVPVTGRAGAGAGSGVVMSRPAVIVGAPQKNAGTVPRIRKAREDEGRGFGQGLISEKSLDEVILAYLSEDADEK